MKIKIHYYRFMLSFCLMGFACLSALAQEGGKKQLILGNANGYYSVYSFAQAAGLYEQYMLDNNHPDFNACLNLADCYWNLRKYSMALTTYENLLSNDKIKDKIQDKLKVRIADLYARSGNYAQAAEWLNRTNGFEERANAFLTVSGRNALVKDSALWKVKALGINTAYREFSPTIIGTDLIFSSNKPLNVRSVASEWDGQSYAKLWKLSLAYVDSISDDINTNDKNRLSEQGAVGSSAEFETGDNNEIVTKNQYLARKQYISADRNAVGTLVGGQDEMKFNASNACVDKNKHIYFSTNYSGDDKKKLNRLCIMEGVYGTNGIESATILPLGNDSYSVMHPAVNADGTLLVFASNKPGGKGGYDLYYAQRRSIKDHWTGIKPLSELINRVGEELFPFISEENILYFSSNSRAGLGGLDIYAVPLSDAISGSGNVRHLSYPINSNADDFGFYSNNKLDGFFSSDRVNSDDNLYSFQYTRENLKLKGKIRNKDKSVPTDETTVFVYDPKTSRVSVVKMDKNGEYNIQLDNPEVVVKAVSSNFGQGCVKVQNKIKSDNPTDVELSKSDIVLSPIEDEYDVSVNLILYDFDKYDVRPDARPILDSLVTLLRSNPGSIQLSSYTDNRGSDAYNLVLSKNRALAASKYLTSKGVPAKRITANGYGKVKRSSEMNTEEEFQSDRKTNIKIVYDKTLRIRRSIVLPKYVVGEKYELKDLPEGFFDKCK